MAENRFLTIRELAEKIGTTKNRVAYQVRKLGDEGVEIIDGVKHLSSRVQELVEKEINQLESDEISDNNQGVNDKNTNSNDAMVIEVLRQRIESLESDIDIIESQLKVKDKQIDQLHTIIASQSQQLNVQLLEYEDSSKSWWKRLFSK